MPGNMWVGLADTCHGEWTNNGEWIQHKHTTVARRVLESLSWEVEKGVEKLEVTLGMGGDEWTATVRAHEEDMPSVRLGEDAWEALQDAGWEMNPEDWETERTAYEPQMTGADMIFQGEMKLDEGYESDESVGPGSAAQDLGNHHSDEGEAST